MEAWLLSISTTDIFQNHPLSQLENCSNHVVTTQAQTTPLLNKYNPNHRLTRDESQRACSLQLHSSKRGSKVDDQKNTLPTSQGPETASQKNKHPPNKFRPEAFHIPHTAETHLPICPLRT